MDTNTILVIAMTAFGIIGGAVGFALKTLHSKSEENEKSINDHKLIVAREYLTRSESANLFAQIDKRFDKMENWIGAKLDQILSREGK